MIFYFLQLLIFVMYSVFFALLKNKKGYFLLTWLHLSCIMGFRSYSVGTDTQMYVQGYLSNSNLGQNSAILYELLARSVKSIFSDNYHVFLFILSAISIGAFLFVIFKWTNNFFASFLSIYIYITFYFYFNGFNMQRQMLAVTLSMMAIFFWVTGSKKESIIYFLISFGIHNTAILSMLNIFIEKLKDEYSNIYKILIVCLLILPISSKIINFFAKMFPHYSLYSNNFSSEAFSTNGGTILLGLLLLFFVVITPLINNTFFNNHINAMLAYLTCIGSYMYIFGFNSQLIIRLADYFAIYCTIYFPRSFEAISARFKEKTLVKYCLLFLTVIAGIILMYYKLSKNMGQIIPYSV